MTTEKIEQMESKLDQTPRRLLPQKPLRTGGYTASLGLVELVAILLGLLYLVPFYYVIVNSFKSIAEIYTNTSALPNVWLGSNYTEAWEAMNYGRVFFNSLFITAGANLFIVIFTSMAAWKLVRTKHWISTVIFFLFVAAMVIPFQSIMIPLVKVSSILGLLNSHWGLMIMYLGFGSGISVFLYHGFMKSIPEEIEEAAIIDGCSTWGVFWRIVFPLLKPITVTIVILNSLWIWNVSLTFTCPPRHRAADDSARDVLFLRTIYKTMGFGTCWFSPWDRSAPRLFLRYAKAYYQRDHERLDQITLPKGSPPSATRGRFFFEKVVDIRLNIDNNWVNSIVNDIERTSTQKT